MTHWALPLIGQPWTEERNCWWLVRTVFREQLGIDLPLVNVRNGIPEEITAGIRESSRASGWRPTDSTNPQEFDVVLMQGPLGKHIGVVIHANGHFGLLHNLEDVGVTFQKFSEVQAIGYRNFEHWRHA